MMVPEPQSRVDGPLEYWAGGRQVIGFIADSNADPDDEPGGGEDFGTLLATAFMYFVFMLWLLSSLSVPREGRPRPPFPGPPAIGERR